MQTSFYETIDPTIQVTVQLPSHLNSPGSTLTSSQQVVTMCDSLSLTLSAFTFDGGRPLTVTWSLVQPTSNANALVSYLLSQNNQTAVAISPSLLTKFVTYTVNATLTNFLAQKTSKLITFIPTGCLQASSTFSADLSSLLISFASDDYTLSDSSQNAQQTSTSALCSYLFSQGTLNKMGTAPTCA